MMHALKHTKYGSITRHNKPEQELSVIVKLGALQTHNEVQNFITHLLINGTIIVQMKHVIHSNTYGIATV